MEDSIPDAGYDEHTVLKMLKVHFKEDSTKASSDSVRLVSEVLRCFVSEAVHRASMEAQHDGTTIIDPEHISKILPQLLLDF